MQSKTPNPAPAVGMPTRTLRMLFESRRRIATVLAIAFAILLGYHVMVGHNGITAYQQKRNEDKALQTEINSLQDENEKLKDHVERLKADPKTIEHEAKEHLHYTRPDEIIYTLNDRSPDSAPAQKPAK
ncbi:MAG TPA: septum formation initiator family protein [Acidisarcina sp.]|nr:septum formation initiator family protein [Acidisarcina sp.]